MSLLKPSHPGLLAIATVGSTSFPSLIDSLLSIASLSALLRLKTAHLVIQFGRSIPSLPSHLTRPSTNNKAKSFSATFALDEDPDQVLELLFVEFTHSIDTLLSIANIVISHAGAGSILSSLRPSLTTTTSSSSPPPPLSNHSPTHLLPIDNTNFNIPYHPHLIISNLYKKFIILIPNNSLMDNHQFELSYQICKSGWALTCSPITLPETLQTLVTSPKTVLEPSHQQHQQEQSLIDRSQSSETNDETVARFGWVPDKFQRFLDLQLGFGGFKTE